MCIFFTKYSKPRLIRIRFDAQIDHFMRRPGLSESYCFKPDVI